MTSQEITKIVSNEAPEEFVEDGGQERCPECSRSTCKGALGYTCQWAEEDEQYNVGD